MHPAQCCSGVLLDTPADSNAKTNHSEESIIADAEASTSAPAINLTDKDAIHPQDITFSLPK